MALSIRALVPLIANAVLVHVNKMRLDLLKLRGGLIFHADATQAVTVADITAGSLLAAQVAITADISAQYVAHIASAADATTGIGAHIAADATHVLTTPAGTTLGTCEARLNEVKAQYNLHCAATANHPLADATNTVSTADATDATTLAALATALHAKMNAHFAAAFNAQALLLVSP
ncbi:MAG: hypothetical protein JWN36_2398 [Microbacteriaceae bacterium]|nr:hypothetical protein [Microbacteriaceae bacterium]